MRQRSRVVVVAGALAATLALGGCGASEPLAEGFGSGQGYISGDGSELELPVPARDAPVEFEGETSDGETISSDELAGDVVVVNFWYANCPPCRAEADDLQAVHEEFADEGVRFIGVNTNDSGASADAFERQYGIEYPSILDAERNRVQLAFAGSVPPNAVPTTLVLDREGRVAARISGRLQARSILESMIERVLAEDA